MSWDRWRFLDQGCSRDRPPVHALAESEPFLAAKSPARRLPETSMARQLSCENDDSQCPETPLSINRQGVTFSWQEVRGSDRLSGRVLDARRALHRSCADRHRTARLQRSRESVRVRDHQAQSTAKRGNGRLPGEIVCKVRRHPSERSIMDDREKKAGRRSGKPCLSAIDGDRFSAPGCLDR